MKIALVSPYDLAAPGGVTEHVLALAAAVQRRGHTVQILAPHSADARPPAAGHIHPLARRVAPVHSGGAVARIGASPVGVWRAAHHLRAQNFDVVHLHEPFVPGICWGVLWQAGRLPHTATVGTFHAYRETPERFAGLARPVFRRLSARLDGLIAVSEAARQFAAQRVAGDYRIIPNGVDLARFGAPAAAPRRPDDGKITLLFVGRPDARKGFAALFSAFLQLKPRFPRLKLQVVGPFSARLQRRYLRQAARRGATDVEFAGYISQKELPVYYHRADIFCAPSTGCESFGIVLLEAMAAGLPLVASDIAGYRAAVTPGREGLLAPPGQPDALARAVEYLLNRPRLRRQMGQAGQHTARRYSWDSVAENVLAVYHRVAKTAQPAQTGLPAPANLEQRALPAPQRALRRLTHDV